jgi:hypothetical protein
MTELAEPKKFTEEERKLRWELYSDHKKQVWEDTQKSTDSYDQSLLTLSSGGLVVSIAFIKDLVPLHDAVWLRLLYVSWALFILTILFTVASFLLSVKAQNKQLGFLWKFYVEGDDGYRDLRSWYSKSLDWCTLLGGTFFLAAVVCTAVFATKNVARYSKMSEPTKSVRLDEGLKTLPMTPLPTGSVQPNKAKVPTTTSTPAVQSDATLCASSTPSTSQPPRKP